MVNNQFFPLNGMLNYFHHFGTERCRSEIYKKITPKYESSLFFLIKFFSDIEKFLFTVVEFKKHVISNE